MSKVNELMALVREGMDVYGSDGEKLGEVGDVNIGTSPSQMVTSQSTSEERSYFQVTKGFLGLTGDMWLPGAAITQVDDGRVTLRYPSDEAGKHGWNSEPTAPEPGTSSGRSSFDLGLHDGR